MKNNAIQLLQKIIEIAGKTDPAVQKWIQTSRPFEQRNLTAGEAVPHFCEVLAQCVETHQWTGCLERAGEKVNLDVLFSDIQTETQELLNTPAFNAADKALVKQWLTALPPPPPLKANIVSSDVTPPIVPPGK